MSVLKSLSVGDGDVLYKEHNRDSFTIIDWCLSDDNKAFIPSEFSSIATKKGITRFISTYPDGHHMRGFKYLDATIGIPNLYCVKRETTKEDDNARP